MSDEAHPAFIQAVFSCKIEHSALLDGILMTPLDLNDEPLLDKPLFIPRDFAPEIGQLFAGAMQKLIDSKPRIAKFDKH